MASSASPPLRQILDDKLAELTRELEQSAAASAADAALRSRGETADRLNQAVRRMRQAAGGQELSATLLDCAAAFGSSVALFGIEGNVAKGEAVRGVAAETEAAFPALSIPLAEAPALAAAVETLDPVVSITTPAELSPALSEFWKHPEDSRAFLFPLAPRGRAVALLYAWGEVESPALELLTQIAAAVSSGFQSSASGLVALAPAADSGEAQPETAWDKLSREERALHLRAQRFARVRASEILLNHGAAVRLGRSRRAVYPCVKEPVDAAREQFRASYIEPCASMVDYLHLELVRTLADDDPELLGKTYPGILV